MRLIALVFLVVYLLNLVPAFAPPTWMVFSFLGFRNGSSHVTLLAVVGAVAATLGRVTLAKMSHFVIRQKLMTNASRENVDAIRQRLEGRKKVTFGLFLFYAFTPFPSNFLFIAYGLTAMNLTLVAIPFFIGRAFSYSIWGLASSAVAQRISVDYEDSLPYLGLYFILSQVALLSLVYVFTKIDWRALFDERKLKWLRPSTPPSPPA
jgi:membrane protein YqaA with SNARE-associated domain